MKTSKAVPFLPPCDANGKPLEADPGYCLRCGQYVEMRRDEAGCTQADDPAWATEDGDYGCNASPESCEDGCGNHARPYDLALMIVKLNNKIFDTL